MMSIRWATGFLLGLGLFILADVETANSDMIIQLKDGRVLTLPIEPGELESITFGEPPAASQREIGNETPTASDDAINLIRVGPTRLYKVPSQAARVAKDGSIVEIDAGLYPGDVAIWRQNDIVLRGVEGLAHLDAQGNAAERKAIWVIKGDNVTVEGIEFSGCRVPDKNGAGIRLEGRNLTVRNSYFHDNEMGILTGKKPDSDIVIEFSEFYRNTVDYKKYGRLGHNIYIGKVRSFILRGSYVHGAMIGHNVKTWARTNHILYNRIMDEADGGSSYLVDLAGGGDAHVVGNIFHQSAHTDNWAMISYAAEGGRENAGAQIYVVNNTFLNELGKGVFFQNRSASLANLVNNIFVGDGTLVEGPSRLVTNLVNVDPRFANVTAHDYNLIAGSPAIDVGQEPNTAGDVPVVPEFEYVHPTSVRPRPRQGALDAGAYEFAGP